MSAPASSAAPANPRAARLKKLLGWTLLTIILVSACITRSKERDEEISSRAEASAIAARRRIEIRQEEEKKLESRRVHRIPPGTSQDYAGEESPRVQRLPGEYIISQPLSLGTEGAVKVDQGLSPWLTTELSEAGSPWMRTKVLAGAPRPIHGVRMSVVSYEPTVDAAGVISPKK